MPQLTADDLKVRGIAAIESALAEQTEATISVRGKDRFMVMDMAQYHYLRECELEAALRQSHHETRHRTDSSRKCRSSCPRCELAGSPCPGPVNAKREHRIHSPF